MKKVNKQKIWTVLGTLVMLLPLFLGLGQASVKAADEETPFPEKVNITLHKKQYSEKQEEKENNGMETNFGGDPLNGVTFDVHDVTDAFYAYMSGDPKHTFEEAVDYFGNVKEENIDYTTLTAKDTKETSGEGKAVFSDLPSVVNGHNAVYVFVEQPKDGVEISHPIVVTLPMYTVDEEENATTTVNNDIHLYPKNVIPDRNVNLKKVGTDTDKALAGAEFILRNEKNEYYTGIDINTGVATWGTKDKVETLKTTTDLLSIPGLMDGTYTLVETKAPEGYLEITAPDYPEFKFSVSGNKLDPEGGKNFLTDLLYPYGNPENYTTANHASIPNTLVVENLKVSDKYFVKVDANSETPLDGAEFEIRKTATSEDYLVEITNGTGYKYAWYSEVKDNTDITFDTVTITSKDGGKFSIDGLKEGTYYLKETTAPDGYVLPDDATPFTVPGKKGTTEADPEPVKNQPKGVLPSTGGKGIIAFVAIGVALVGGVGFYFMKRSKSTEA